MPLLQNSPCATRSHHKEKSTMNHHRGDAASCVSIRRLHTGTRGVCTRSRPSTVKTARAGTPGSVFEDQERVPGPLGGRAG